MDMGIGNNSKVNVEPLLLEYDAPINEKLTGLDAIDAIISKLQKCGKSTNLLEIIKRLLSIHITFPQNRIPAVILEYRNAINREIPNWIHYANNGNYERLCHEVQAFVTCPTDKDALILAAVNGQRSNFTGDYVTKICNEVRAYIKASSTINKGPYYGNANSVRTDVGVQSPSGSTMSTDEAILFLASVFYHQFQQMKQQGDTANISKHSPVSRSPVKKVKSPAMTDHGANQIKTNWLVTYRGKDGKQVSILISAVDRKSLFNELSKRGISAIRVEQSSTRNNSKSHNIVYYALLGIVVVAVIGAFLCCFNSRKGDDAKPIYDKRPAKIATVEPSIPTNKAEHVPEAKESARDPGILSIRTTINPFTGEEMLFTNRHKQVKANAGVISRDFGNNKHKPKRLLFKHSSENYICGLMRTPLGVPIVRGRLPKNFDDDFVKSYADEIKIEEEDTEEDIALKQAMIDFKEEIKDQIANGASVSQIVLEAREEQNKLADYRRNLMKTLGDMRREGASREDLDDAREAANIMLNEKGLKQIPKDLPRIGEEE